MLDASLQVPRGSQYPPYDRHGSRVDLGPLSSPLFDDPVQMILVHGHGG
jgi:hypothetical protein